MKFADGNSQLVSSEHSITTPPRRNIPMTGAKYGGSAKRIFNTHNIKDVFFLNRICEDNSSILIRWRIIMPSSITARGRVLC